MESNQPPPSPPLTSETPPPSDGGSSKIKLNQPCRVTNVRFEGVHRTRPTVMAKIVADLFPSKSVLDLLENILRVRDNLTKLNAFSDIEFQVNEIDVDDYEVMFVMKERGRILASAQTSVDNFSTHLSLDLTLPNLAGIGDSMKLNSKFNKKFYSGEWRYSVPLTPWRHLWAPNYSLSCSQYQWDSLPSGFDQDDRSVINQLEFYSMPQLKHSISFENVWRHIKSSSVKTPIEIREQCGHSVKSSINHTLTWDTRIGANFPYEGLLAKLSNEFALNLVNGGARFTRHEANVQFNKLILPKYDLLCQVNVLAGTLFKPYKTNICDRFFAGGPLTLRGFKFQGLKPNVRDYPLGEASYLSAGIHFYSILPYTTPETPINHFVRAHLFFNTGTLGDIHDIGRVTSRGDLKRELIRFRDSLRYSCGFGLVMYFMSLRLEVNYCLPLVFQNGDLCLRGVQWGFGLTYT